MQPIRGSGSMGMSIHTAGHMDTAHLFGCVVQDAVVARQYLSDNASFQRQARLWTGAKIASGNACLGEDHTSLLCCRVLAATPTVHALRREVISTCLTSFHGS